jgi:hypothetical protein
MAVSIKTGQPDPMPLANDLNLALSTLFDRPKLQKPMAYTLNQLAEYYEKDGHARKDLLDWLRRELRDQDRQLPDRFAHSLGRVPFKGFATTNYDTLLERTIQRSQGFPPTVFACERTVDSPSPQRVYKLCGTIDRADDTVLITDDDFDRKFGDRNHNGAVLDRVREAFRDMTIVFLGFSLRDTFFRFAWADALERFLEMKKRAYAVLLNVDRYARSYWDRRNVTLVEAHISDFVHRLARTIDPTTDEQEMVWWIAQKRGKEIHTVQAEIDSLVRAGAYHSRDAVVRLEYAREVGFA